MQLQRKFREYMSDKDSLKNTKRTSSTSPEKIHQDILKGTSP